MNTQDLSVSVEGYVEIKDFDTGEMLYCGRNAIHKENMSVALALGMSRDIGSFISEMHFGCGAAICAVDGTMTYRTPNVTGISADLYQATYFRVVDDTDANNSEKIDSVQLSHTSGTDYADIVVTAILDNNQPLANDLTYNLFDQSLATIDGTIYDGEFEFNEIGLKTKGTSGLNSGKLLTHFIFHPVTKNAEQRIQVTYTLRVRAGV